MVNYIMLGPPGSGKGTQAKKLAEKLNGIYFGTGDLMRQEAQKGTEFGEKFKAVWDEGQGGLVAEGIVESFVENKLKELDRSKPVIFDGFPRTIKQAELFQKYISDGTLLVFNIAVAKESLILRATTRRVCRKCGKIFLRAEESGIRMCDVCGGELIQRQEDKPETIKKRIEVYERETQPVIDFYRKKGILRDIDGEPPIDVVEKEIWEKVNV